MSGCADPLGARRRGWGSPQRSCHARGASRCCERRGHWALPVLGAWNRGLLPPSACGATPNRVPHPSLVLMGRRVEEIPRNPPLAVSAAVPLLLGAPPLPTAAVFAAAMVLSGAGAQAQLGSRQRSGEGQPGPCPSPSPSPSPSPPAQPTHPSSEVGGGAVAILAGGEGLGGWPPVSWC